jgi:hypothetical protein
MVVLSSFGGLEASWPGVRAPGAAAEGHVDLVEHGLQLVEVEVLELQGAREHDAALVEPVARVDQLPRVELEEQPEETRRGRSRSSVADVDPDDDERRIDPDGDGGLLGAGFHQERVNRAPPARDSGD